MIETLYFDGDDVVILNQAELPERISYERCTTVEQVADAISSLKVRGAPLIGVTAAFGLAMAVGRFSGEKPELPGYFEHHLQLLAGTRPTAVNLFWALERMRVVFQGCLTLTPREIARELRSKAQAMFVEDVRANNRMGDYGQELLEADSRVMTICNAGALATCGYGTALGVVRAAHKQGKIKKVWACETRPVLQGSRLTVWELTQDRIPVTLITDGMAGYVMQLGQVDAVLVGADRIAANGDVANKIGTYTLATLAHHHGIPFYVVAPFSSVDLERPTGKQIPVEERDHEEVRSVRGVPLTLPGVDVFNPAFDITPAELVTGIITERGVTGPPFPEGLYRLAQRGERHESYQGTQ
jgi:methylthioribose-1-phosphate isomerase